MQTTPSPYSAVKYQKGNEFMEEILALEHISKAYSGNPVLNDITIRLHKGEVVSLVGEKWSRKIHADEYSVWNGSNTCNRRI